MRSIKIPGWLLLVVFVVLPLIEIFFIIKVGQLIGPWWTILLLLVDSIFGAWLVKREWRKAWTGIKDLRSGFGMSNAPIILADAALILIGATLMLTPGFVTDLLAVFFLLPATRPVARNLLGRILKINFKKI